VFLVQISLMLLTAVLCVWVDTRPRQLATNAAVAVLAPGQRAALRV
jgi:hypothetical protein